jgi:hypothetical protein
LGRRAAARGWLGMSLLLGTVVAAAAQDDGRESSPADMCLVPPADYWSPVEQAAWQCVCRGAVAAIGAADCTREEAEAPPRNWLSEWTVSTRFVTDVLLREPYKSAMPAGLRLDGARFVEAIDLKEFALDKQLWLDNSLFEGEVDLSRLNAVSLVSFEGSTFEKDVILDEARIDGSINLQRAKVLGGLWMQSASIGRKLSIAGAEFGAMEIIDSDIAKQLNAPAIKVNRTFAIDTSSVGGGMILRDAKLNHIVFRGDDFQGQLDLTGTTVTGGVDFDSTRIGSDLLLRNGTFEGSGDLPFNLIFLNVGGNLSLSGSVFADVTEGKNKPARIDAITVDMTGAMIEGYLELGSQDRSKPTPPPIWSDRHRLVLQHARAGVLRHYARCHPLSPHDDAQCSWPKEIDLDGFAYKIVASDIVQAGVDGDSATSLIDWLARDSTYSPQPYSFLAGLLRESGYAKPARDLLYASQDRARDKAWNEGRYFRWFRLAMLDWTIGYGIGGGYFMSLFWVMGFVIAGWLVLLYTGAASEISPPSRCQARTRLGRLLCHHGDLMIYSLDRLLPLVDFQRYHDPEVKLTGTARYYFVLHASFGYVLGSFVVLGIAGITV